MGNREYVGWIVGDNLREVRKSKKMTIEDMCEKTGLSESHLRNVNTDELVHTARSSSACFPVFQCTLSAA